MVKMSPNQERQLDKISKADSNWRQARISVETEIRKQVAAALSKLEADRATAVVEGVRMDIPKSQIGKIGLHTKDPYAVAKVLEEYKALEGVMSIVSEAQIAAGRFTWTSDTRDTVVIHEPNYSEMKHVQKYVQWSGTELIGAPKTLQATVRLDNPAEFDAGRVPELTVLEDGNRTPNSPRLIDPYRPETEYAEGPISIEIDAKEFMYREMVEWMRQNR